MLFEDSGIPSIVTLHFKKMSSQVSFSVTMDRYTLYYINQSGGGEIGRVYMASFRVQMGNVIIFFLEDSRFFKPLLYSGERLKKKRL